MTHQQPNTTLLQRMQASERVEKDPRRRVWLTASKILWESEPVNSRVENSQALLINRPVQPSLHNDNLCILRNEGNSAGIILDFGQEIHGGLVITVSSVDGADSALLRIRFGESVMETMSEIGESTNATNDHAMRDITVPVRWLSMNPVGELGFRFVRIDLVTPNVSVAIHAVKASLVYRDLPYLGSFSCSDPLLEKIWNTGAYTVHLNMQKYLWDGIKRDRLVWIGDLHPEIATVQAVFGDQKLIRDSLDLISSQTPPEQWMNDIPSYSMWWIIIQHDYFMQFGDKEYLMAQLPYMKALYQHISQCIDENGKDTTPEMRFVDWPTKNNPVATDTGMQALHIISTHCAKEVFEIFGENELAEQCRKDCEKLRQYPIDCCGKKQIAALAVLAGLMDPKKADEEILKKDGAEGMTTFMGYYILLAQALAGDFSGALDVIRSYWGGMLKMGATTFWEDFDIKWMENAAPIDRMPLPGEVDIHGSYGRYCYQGYRHSLCHGWASGVTSWLSRYVLGVEILEPGCKKIRVNPQLGDLEWVRGTYPTPYGVIELYHYRKEDGTVQSQIHAPEGVTVLC